MKKILFCVTGLLIFSTSNALDEKDAKKLGWTTENNICGGYFIEGDVPQGNLPKDFKSTPISLEADQGQLLYDGVSSVSGHVSISQPGRIVTSNKASLVAKEGDFQTAKLEGEVTVKEKNRVVVGEEANLNLKEKWYQLKNSFYRLLVGEGLSGWGTAAEVTEPPSEITELKNITYSTCPPQSRAWNLTAKRLELDQNKGRGSAYGVVMYAKGIPLFYTPFMNFPLDDRRQSGFLYPKFSFGSTSGFGLGLPYYWNIAPNQDDTIMPYFYQKRGFQLNNQYRYLTQTSRGEFDLSILPNDYGFRKFQQTEPFQFVRNTPQIMAGIDDLSNASTTRSLFTFQNSTSVSNEVSALINYTHVSDDYYSQDFGGVPFIAQNQLIQQAQVSYQGESVNFLGNLQSFQTLHPVNEPVVLNQYNMLPQLLFSSRFAPRVNKFNFEWQAEGVEFTKARDPGSISTPPSGERLNFIGAISFPWNTIAGYFTPKLGEQFTQYNVGDQPVGLSDEITRSLPFFNIDSGLYFDRSTHIYQHDYTQTLEPRIFYLYVPYKDQQDIPIFDGSLQPFSYNQLFLINRFSGEDRIGDANQISFALTSRFLDKKSGSEKFSASAGIIKYLASRKVLLCQGQNCQNIKYSMGSSTNTDPVSPLVGQLQYHFSPIWSTTLDAAWDPNIAQAQNASLAFQYSPMVNHIINFGYSYIRNGDYFTLPNQPAQTPNKPEFNLSQPTASFAWPINDRWSAVGSFGYSLNRTHPLTYFGGLQYNSCCWGVQFVLARSFSGFDPYSLPEYNTGAYVQLVFKGLAKIAGNDPASLLLSNIPGYHDTFGA
jgi:LPS-assembly protein